MNISWILIQIYFLLLYHTYGSPFYVNEYSTAILRCPLKADSYSVNWRGPPNLTVYSINDTINPSLLHKNRLSVVGSQNNLQISSISKTDAGLYQCTGLVINSTASASVELMIIVAPESDPVVTTNASVPLFAGNIIALKCEVIGGLPLANISWQCDGSYDQQNDSTKLKIESVVKLMLDTTHNKSCACVASHLGWPSAKTTYIFLDVFYAPNRNLTIQQIPTGGIINGNHVTLTCRASGGNPLATLSWNCTGITNVVTDGTSVSNSLKLKVNERDYNKVCVCSAVHPVLTFQPFAQTELLVYYAPDNPPEIRQTPSGGIHAGDKVRLTCTVSGGNPLAILTWDCNDNSVNNTSNDMAEYSIDLTVDKSDNNRLCSCKASHLDSTYKPIARHKLIVYYAPDTNLSITQNPIGGILNGNTVTLTCTVSGGNPLATLTWSCNGTKENHTAGITVSYSIKLLVDKRYNNKMCTCTGQHVIPTYQSILNHNMVVFFAPDFSPMIQQTPTGGIVSGNNVTLTCSVEGGNPLADLYWNCTGYISNNTAVSTAKYTVEFTVNKTQNGEICECSAKHPVASYTPVVRYRLDVYFKPFLDQTRPYSPPYVSAAENNSLHLQLTVNANPTPTIEWKFRTQADWDSCNVITIVSNTTTNRFLTSSSVLVDDVQSDIFGEYTFSANNTVGTFFRRFVVIKEANLAQVKCPITNENTGMFLAGIVTLIVGLMSLTAAVTFVVRNGLKNKALNSSKNVEYSDMQRSNPAFTDAYTTLQSNIESTVPSEQTINSYEECGRTPEAHTYKPSQYQQHGVNTYEKCGKRIEAHTYDTLDK